MKTMGAPVGSCNNPAVNTSKLLLNLNPLPLMSTK